MLHSSTTIPTSRVQCGFVRPSCEDQDARPLFSGEYKRTNRTRDTKIVRCFPHCCPSHRPRSYCGTSLHVEISAASDDLPKLTVLGRFEEHRPEFSSREDISESSLTHLELGQHVKPSEIHSQPSRKSPWVTGKLLDGTASSRQRYVLHGSDDGFNHWEHDWKSGTSQRQRLTQHHFRVYVFAEHSHDNWEVVGVVTSPPFTFAVYRKHQHDPELLRLKAEKADQTTQRRSHEEHNDGDSAESGDSDDDQGQLRASVVRDLLWHHRHRSIATTTTRIAILGEMLLEADSQWLTMHSRSLFAVIQAASDTERGPAISQRDLLHYVNHCVPKLAALLPLREDASILPLRYEADRVRLHERHMKWQTTMKLLSGLLCFMLEPAQLSTTLEGIFEPTDSADTIRERYIGWVEGVSSQIEGFLQGHGQSTESLVDDIVSVVLSDKARRGLHHQLRSLLRNTTVIGQGYFAAFCAEVRQRLPVVPVDAFGLHYWDGEWVCRGFEHPGDQRNPNQRRQSWPQLQPLTAPTEAGSNVVCGMLTGMATLLTAFGIRTTRQRPDLVDDNHDEFCVSLLASPFAQAGFKLPLDHEFRDAKPLLPVEWSTLLLVGSPGSRVFIRARSVVVEGDDNGAIELEFFAVDTNNLKTPWRCVLRFELTGAGTFSALLNEQQGSSHRRLVIHVQVDEAEKHSRPVINDRESKTAQAQQLYASVKMWSTISAFKGIYSSPEE